MDVEGVEFSYMDMEWFICLCVVVMEWYFKKYGVEGKVVICKVMNVMGFLCDFEVLVDMVICFW